MGRRSKRSVIAHGIHRKEGLFARSTDPSEDLDCSLEAEPGNHMDDLLQNHNDTTGLSFFADWWTINRPEMLQCTSKRPLVYTGDSDRTVRRKNANASRALAACPMQPISSFFKPTELLTNLPAESPLSSKLSPEECVSILEKICNDIIKRRCLHGPTAIIRLKD